jgi:hypothetical protein
MGHICAHVYIPCAAHSLNLVGCSAVESCVNTVSFFGFLQQLFTFFSASTHRWSVLLTSIGAKGLTVKSLCKTRWSARADAVKALSDGYTEIKFALNVVADDDKQKAAVRHEARSLSHSMDRLETAFLCKMWNIIMSRFDATSKSLQRVDIDLQLAVELLQSLTIFVESLRSQFDDLEAEAKEVCGPESNYKTSIMRRKRRNKRYDDQPSDEVILTSRDEFRTQTYFVIIDRLLSALQKRCSAYEDVINRFKVLIKSSIMPPEDIAVEARQLAHQYPGDLDVNVFPAEFTQFAAFAKTKNCMTPISQASLLYSENLMGSFPNAFVALRIYLSLMITNCTGERSFSKMAIIKNKLRSSMANNRLTALAILSIESDVVRQMSFDDIIDDFAAKKSRKCDL